MRSFLNVFGEAAFEGSAVEGSVEKQSAGATANNDRRESRHRGQLDGIAGKV